MKKQAARARWVLAFSAARRKDYSTARERFGLLRNEASQLPDHGKPEAKLGENPPTLEEEGAYQHAVLTAALGDKAGAEAEYVAFMRAYPESPLVHGAVQRIGRMHGGNVPKHAGAVWQQAMAAAQARQKERQREASVCGPECLAEVLRRHATGGSQSPSVTDLAQEMGTDDRGTSFAAMAKAARKHGFSAATGLKLTWKGFLAEARVAFPPVHPAPGQGRVLLALLRPGHFVVVENADFKEVRVWNPDGRGVGQPSYVGYTPWQWQQAWTGIVLRLSPSL